MDRTKEQKKAIAIRGCNVLVAAAAGSGKTSVLIERILTMVSDEQHPVDIDRLLVVTFTNAAAAEMRERMEEALEEKFLAHPENKNLQKQMALLRRSHIMTIDSFCAEVLRNHFQLIDLDPSFRIADRAELKLLQEDVLADVLEECYQSLDEGFLQLVDSYAPGRNDAAMEEMVLSLYKAAAAYPDPKGWLLEQRAEIERFSEASFEQEEWMKKLLFYMKTELGSCQAEVERLLNLCRDYEGLLPYRKTLQQDQDMLAELLLGKDYQGYARAFFSLSFAKLGRLTAKGKEKLEEELSKQPGETSAEELIEEVKKGRDAVKKMVSAMKDNYFPELSKERREMEPGKAVMEELSHDLGAVRKRMLAMMDTVLKFSEAYTEQKRERNILDFSDQEHLALNVLTDQNGNPTKAALEMREYFEEILIDEYQDSNRLQEAILTSISRGNNMFLVGDVKQSIYKFRLARPELFMEKYSTYAETDVENTYGKPESESCKIDLSKNFRSRKSVLDTVNFLFSRIMGKQFGNIEYDDAAALYYGSGDSYGPSGMDKSEIILITENENREETGKEETAHEGNASTQQRERNKIELEAAHIALRIKKLVLEREFEVRTKNGTRPAEYGDIAILLRTMSGWSEVFLKVLEEAGIPAVTAVSKGYFEASEVKVMLNLLKIIDNEQQDIPLAAVMLSPIGNFSEEELALIRAKEKEGGFSGEKKENVSSLYYACRTFLEKKDKAEEKEDIAGKTGRKLDRFFKLISHFRDLAACLTVPELIEQILFMTGYDSCVRAMMDGEKRYGNVRILIQKAEDFEKTSYHGLFQFNRYIERLKKYEIDFGEADTSSSMNTVRIMSIHKSKGLEFPVVFVAGMGKQFNLMDTRKNLVIHPDLGPGPDYVDMEKKIQVPTVLKKVLQKDMIVETLAEELRVLYVAMTRAGEKLILTGFTENVEESRKKWIRQGSFGRKLPFHVLGQAKTFLDMIMPVFLWEEKKDAVSGDAFYKTGFDTCPVEILIRENLDLLSQEAGSKISREIKQAELFRYRHALPEKGEEEALYQEIVRQTRQKYRYEEAVQLKTKFTVSELKKADFSEEEEFDVSFDLEEMNMLEKAEIMGNRPAVLQVPDTDMLPERTKERQETQEREKRIPSFFKTGEKELSGAALGTVYHKVMQWLDFTHADTPLKISRQLGKLEKDGILSKEERKLVRPAKIAAFASCALGARIAKAQKEGRLFREQPFVMGVDAQIFMKKTERQENRKEKEIVLVQGIIDLFFEENGKLVLLDYKTDRVRTAEELKQRYDKQLDYYAQALVRARNLAVGEKYLYSFRLEELIPV